MRFRDYALWNPFAILKNRPSNPGSHAKQISNDLNIKEEIEMTDHSEFELPSAILAAALVEKSDLKGSELEESAAKVQRWLILRMKAERDIDK